MNNNSERNYFDYATEQDITVKNKIDECRNWREKCKDLSTNQIFDKYLTIVKNMEVSYNSSWSTAIDYVVGLVKDIFAECIEKDKKINNTTLDMIFKRATSDIVEGKTLPKVESLKTFCKNVIDTIRMKKNHEIISKRFDIKELLYKTYFIDKRKDTGYLLPFIFSICRKLDTYNLELPDKINLMCEEIAFVIDHEYRYTFKIDITDWEELDKYSQILRQVVPGVMTYILGTYSSEGIPKDIIEKVIVAASSKVNNSSYFKFNRSLAFNLDYFNQILHPEDKDLGVRNRFFTMLSSAQIDGSINTKSGLIDLIFKELSYDIFNIKDVLDYIVYYYGIFTNDFIKYNISIRKIINSSLSIFIKDHNSNTAELNCLIFELERALRQIIFFSQNLKPVIMYTENESKDFVERYKYISKEIDELIVDVQDKLYYFNNKKNKTEVKNEDVHDDTGLPLTLSNYERKILASSEVMINRLNESVSDKKDFIDIATDKSILVHKEATDFLSKVVEDCPEYFDLNKLKSALSESYTAISEDQSADTTSERYIAMGEISNIISKINKYNLNKNSEPDFVDESFDFADYNMNDIDLTIKDVVNHNINNFIISETVHNIISIPVHEMKISSYAKLVLDKFRQGYDYLNDKQKAVFDTLDQMADRFSHFDDKEARAEARMQVIKGQMLPPLSKCLKTIIFAGLISIINPWLGLLSIVIKYVTSKNATKEERQAVCDELEVEIQMIDRKIQDAVDDKNYKLERKLRLLKKKMLVQYSKISYDNMVKWDNSLYMKPDVDATGQKIGLKEE